MLTSLGRMTPFKRYAATFGSALIMALVMASPALASRRVVIVSIDGLRPDVALRADMPTLRALMTRGSFTMFAATTDLAVTTPSHVSMLTGVAPEKHGILYNKDPKPGDPPAPAWPTLFALAHDAGLSTALAAGKSKFSVLCQKGTLNQSFLPPAPNGIALDSVVADTAAAWIAKQRPEVLFVHLAGVDITGHAFGWGSQPQRLAIATADRALGRIVRALKATRLADSTLLIVTTDHGGAGTTHGGTDPRSRLIPWIAAGPGVRRDYDLTLAHGLSVRTEDTFATACEWLGLTIGKPVDGRAVAEIWGKPQP